MPGRHSRDVSFGSHGLLIGSLLYRYGALTRSQLGWLLQMNESALDRQLRPLRQSGHVLQCRDQAVWQGSQRRGRPPSVYYLSASGIRYGAREAGIENEQVARRSYKRIQLPETAAHRVCANKYLLNAASRAPKHGYQHGPEQAWSESCPDFPLFGTGRRRGPRSNSGYRYTRIVPDASFTVDYLEARDGDSGQSPLGAQSYHLELETTLRSRQVVEKVRDYIGRWRRLLAPRGQEKKWHDPSVHLEPVIILVQNPGHVDTLLKALRTRVPETEGYQEALNAFSVSSGGRVSPLQMVFVAWFARAARSVFKETYSPVKWDTNDEPPQVDLRQAAYLAKQVTVPESPG